MPKSTDLIGRQFGKLTVVEKVTQKTIKGSVKKGVWWKCECSCGGFAVPTTNAIMNTVRKCPSCVTNEFRSNWLNKVVTSKNYGDFQVIGFSQDKVNVKFLETGYTAVVSHKELISRSVKDYLLPTVSGVGYLGVGPYAAKTYVNGKPKNSASYEVWNGMLKRCYNEDWRTKQGRTSYDGVTVAPEWHNFQNFAKWYEYNKPNYDDCHLDKDLKLIGNRVYSPEACTFVPIQVNSLFTGTKDGRDLPRGVHFCNNKNKYVVQDHVGEVTSSGEAKQSYFGAYATSDEAISVYKDVKKAHCKDVAEKYREFLDESVYYNLVNNALDFIK